MLQLYELCRLCAQKKKNKFDLFTSQTNEESTVLLTKISLCLSVQITREDMLPKIICVDCQKLVEQFNSFKVKCHKAEERLYKMLSIAAFNKINVTQIKQEYIEADYYENSNLQIETEIQKYSEPLAYVNFKPIDNLKSELIDENENPGNPDSSNQSSELIKIISKEIFNQQTCLEDVKEPHIEIISENFDEKLKSRNMCEIENNELSDIKVIPEIVLKANNENSLNLEANTYTSDTEPINFVETKVPLCEMQEETVTEVTSDLRPGNLKENIELLELRNKNKKKGNLRKKIKNSKDLIYDIEEKYLTLRANEVCEIDMEEMEAAIRKKQDPHAKFFCDQCNKSFKFFKCLKKHKCLHDSQPEIFICEICKKADHKSFEFSSLKSLNCHLQRKHTSFNENKFKCSNCKRILRSKGELNAHYKKVHDNSGACCQICGKKFKNKIRLNSHLIVHQDKRPYICDQCGQSFKWRNALKVHMQWHRQEKNFLCSECGKKFTAKKNLVEHMNIHSGNRPFVCKDCNATFVQLSAYSKHLFLHNGKKNIYKCDHCKKSYSHAYILKQHLLRHSGFRPFKCSTCYSSFKSQSDLWCHSKTHQEKQYGCEICGRKFALSKTLRDHMVLHTGKKHICPVLNCKKTYTQRFSLTKHFCKQHPSLSLINRKGGRKLILNEKADLSQSDQKFICYGFKAKDAAN